MDGNAVLGWTLVSVGLADVVIANMFGRQLGLPWKVRRVLSYMGVALALVGSTLVTRKIELF